MEKLTYVSFMYKKIKVKINEEYLNSSEDLTFSDTVDPSVGKLKNFDDISNCSKDNRYTAGF